MRIDLHNHTTVHSPCSTMSPDRMMEAAKETGLDGICITEHNKIWTPEEAAALSEKHQLMDEHGVTVGRLGATFSFSAWRKSR